LATELFAHLLPVVGAVRRSTIVRPPAPGRRGRSPIDYCLATRSARQTVHDRSCRHNDSSGNDGTQLFARSGNGVAYEPRQRYETELCV